MIDENWKEADRLLEDAQDDLFDVGYHLDKMFSADDAAYLKQVMYKMRVDINTFRDNLKARKERDGRS